MGRTPHHRPRGRPVAPVLTEVSDIAVRLNRNRPSEDREQAVELGSKRSADLQSVVSQNSILLMRRMQIAPWKFEPFADCKSAIQQIANLRYELKRGTRPRRCSIL